MDDTLQGILHERYQIQRQLSRKAGRRSLLAYDLQTQTQVVVKLLTLGNDVDWNDLKLFEREAETLKSLAHPAIPRYLDYFELNLSGSKGFALVQSYIEGQSLDDFVKAGRTFTDEEIKQVARALLDILTYLHGYSPPVIHRDIKPSNVLVGDRSAHSVGQVYLVDFGSVQTLAAQEGSTVTVVGTYGYMPPEQFGGRTVPASDLYSVGATLIYLATNTHPADLPHKELRIQFQAPANFSPALTRWLQWLTQPNLKLRPTSAPEALQTLEQLQQEDRAPLVLQKPARSKIRLTKSPDSLDVSFPPRKRSIQIIAIVVGLVITYIIAKLSITIFLYESQLLSQLLGLIFAGGAIGLFITTILYAVFGRDGLSIDRQRIYFFENCKWWRVFELRRQDVTQLVRTHTFNYVGSQDIKPTIFLQGWEVLSEDRFSEAELDWLVQELSDFLNLPIMDHITPPGRTRALVRGDRVGEKGEIEGGDR